MNILLVEDDLFFQNFYSKKLLEHGFKVSVAGDGNEALSKMKVEIPDIVLLDLILPKKDGFEVLKEVSLSDKLNRVPIIVFSTLGQKEDVDRAKKLGAVDYVNKTFFDFDALLAKVKSAVKL